MATTAPPSAVARDALRRGDGAAVRAGDLSTGHLGAVVAADEESPYRLETVNRHDGAVLLTVRDLDDGTALPMGLDVAETLRVLDGAR